MCVCVCVCERERERERDESEKKGGREKKEVAYKVTVRKINFNGMSIRWGLFLYLEVRDFWSLYLFYIYIFV